MMKATIILLALLLALPAWAAPCPTGSYDKDVEPSYDCTSPGEDVVLRPGSHGKSVALEKGAKAPKAGILLEKGKVIDLGMRVKTLRRLRWLDRKAGRRVLKTELKYQAATSKAKTDLLGAQVMDLKTQVADRDRRISKLTRWYRSPVLWFAVGFVVTAGGTAAIIASTR